MCLVKTSYHCDEVTFLLKDVANRVEILDTVEREKRNQSGTHYSEMLPLENPPTENYMKYFKLAEANHNRKTASALLHLAKGIIDEKGDSVVLVSLARGGTPVGILLRRAIKFLYGIDVPHYSISVLRNKGVDANAVKFIANEHSAKNIQFVDGWIGKGTISKEMRLSCRELKRRNPELLYLNPRLAVVSDPSYTTSMCGTREDFLIPSACLNATVSGLISRTYCKEGVIQEDDFHGAVYYEHLKDCDVSNDFLDNVSSLFSKDLLEENTVKESDIHPLGIEIVENIGEDFGIRDLNKIKPGIGETTRVLLRRVPWKVLVSSLDDYDNLGHIYALCKEKNVPIEVYPLLNYKACGLIKDMSADI